MLQTNEKSAIATIIIKTHSFSKNKSYVILLYGYIYLVSKMLLTLIFSDVYCK